MRQSVYRHYDGSVTVGYIEQGKTLKVVPCRNTNYTCYQIEHEGRPIDTYIRTKNEAINRAKRHATVLFRIK